MLEQLGHRRPSEWPALRSVVCIERTRQIRDKTSTTRHYYFSCLTGGDAGYMLRLSRAYS